MGSSLRPPYGPHLLRILLQLSLLFLLLMTPHASEEESRLTDTMAEANAGTSASDAHMEFLYQQKLLENFTPGHVDATLMAKLASFVGDDFGKEMEWLAAHTRFFTFHTHDGISMQGYHIPPPQPSDEAGSAGAHNTQQGQEKPVIVYSCGYTETVVKASRLFQRLHERGYEIFTYDMRQQGFSGSTMFDDGVITYSHSFRETYVRDLDQFVSEIVRKETNSDIIYVGNSLSALIGISYQLQSPGAFSKLVAISPCIMPRISTPEKYAIKAARLMGFNSTVMMRLSRDIYRMDVNIRTSTDTARVMQWQKLRVLAPDYLMIGGLTLAFIHSMIEAGESVLERAADFKADLLMFQAGVEDFVSNDAADAFASAAGSSIVKKIKYQDSYHELLVEKEEIFESLMGEIFHFIRSPPVGSSGAGAVDNKGIENTVGKLPAQQAEL